MRRRLPRTNQQGGSKIGPEGNKVAHASNVIKVEKSVEAKILAHKQRGIQLRQQHWLERDRYPA